MILIISKLHVPQLFIHVVPKEPLHKVRYRVAWHYNRLMHTTPLLRHFLPMPPPMDRYRCNVSRCYTPDGTLSPACGF